MRKEREVMKDKIKIFHVRHCNKVMTIATEVKDDKKVIVGFAFCNPSDTFVKKIGRVKAVGRIKSNVMGYLSPLAFTGHSIDSVIALFNNHKIFKPYGWKKGKLYKTEKNCLAFSSQLST